MNDIVLALVLVTSGFAAGVTFESVTPVPVVIADPDLPVIHERVAEFAKQVDNLERVISHACSIPGVPDVSRPEEQAAPSN